jgi:phosphoribosylglycinamide formyltransferase-1
MGRLGILLSGRGSNFEAIADHIERGDLKAEIAVTVGNVHNAPGLEKARRRRIETIYLASQGLTREEYDQRLVALLKDKRVDLVCLAGFMRLLTPAFIGSFPYRILNIHPSLLPAFPGLHAQRKALEYGAKYSGCTVHFVDEGVDSGPIILQAVVPVLDGDSEELLSSRILAEEHKIYPRAIQLVLDRRTVIEGRRVRIRDVGG